MQPLIPVAVVPCLFALARWLSHHLRVRLKITLARSSWIF